MSYYSELSEKYAQYDYDRSYPLPEEQLLLRLDELYGRLEELSSLDTAHRSFNRLTDSEIRYASPDCFETASEVTRAIELAVYDLKHKYAVDVSEDIWGSSADLPASFAEQISLFDPPKAA